jgi:hypothetical protein
MLMGDNVQGRKDFIAENAKEANLDVWNENKNKLSEMPIKRRWDNRRRRKSYANVQM